VTLPDPPAADDRSDAGTDGLGPGALTPEAPALTRRLLTTEIWVVFALSLGASGVSALLQLIASLTASKSLSRQKALLVGSLAPG
jgi:hypothetical protein